MPKWFNIPWPRRHKDHIDAGVCQPPQVHPDHREIAVQREGSFTSSRPQPPPRRRVVIGTPGPEIEPRPTAERFRTTPYRADVVVDGWSSGRFTVRAASLRGHLHRYNGVPRQDDFGLLFLRSPERLIVAVADGVSSAPQSHLGATISVRFALQWLASKLSDERPTIDWPELMRHCAWQLVEQAAILFPKGQTQTPDAEYAQSLLSTTLVCAIIEFPQDHERATARLAGVGDSGVWLLHNGEFQRIYGGKSSDGSPITSSAVSGLPQVPKELTPVEIALVPDSILLIGTDGFGDPLGSGGGAVGQAFTDRLTAPPGMLDFAGLLDFSRETFDDDRTLVAIWPMLPSKGGSGNPAA